MKNASTKDRKAAYNNNRKRSGSPAAKGRGKGRPPVDKDKEMDTEPRAGGMNDVSWYASNPQLLIDAASLPYSAPVGVKLETANLKSLFPQNYGYEAVPGVCALSVTPTPGISTGNSSPINIAARNLYSFVRHANSGHANYEAPDLMMYVLAMDSIYSTLSHAIRVYGIARTYSQVNRYYPEALIEAMEMNPDDVLNNLAKLRYAINSMIVKAGSLCVPNSLKFINRHYWMFSSVYCDVPDAKSQAFLYVPAGHYVYQPVKYKTGGCLEYAGAGRGYTVDQLIQRLDTMISAVIEDEDMNIMSGDILKAFGSDGVFKLAGIDENYTILPEYNPEVLTQFNNAVAVGNLIDDSDVEVGEYDFRSCDIYQLPNKAIIYDPEFRCSSPEGVHEFVLNMPMPTPTPADTMVATRLTNISSSATAQHNVVEKGDDVWWLHKLSHCGSEVVQYMRIYSFANTYEGTGEWKARPVTVTRGLVYDHDDHLMTYMSCPNDGDCFLNWIGMATTISKFSWHPQIALSVMNDDWEKAMQMDTYIRTGYMGDINTYTLLSEGTLGRMHETALLSMLSVPQMGAVNKA
nr:putative capsid [Marmot picobirnavirus]